METLRKRTFKKALISFESELLKRIDAHCKALDVTRSRYLEHVATEALNALRVEDIRKGKLK